jgi:hypothetical protein
MEMIPFFVSPDGVPLSSSEHRETPSELGTAEVTPMEQLCRIAAKEAEKASTKGKS